MTFVPHDDPAASPDVTIQNDGFFPDLSLAAFRAEMNVGKDGADERLLYLLHASMLEINESLTEWRDTLSAQAEPPATLAQVPAKMYGTESAKLFHYRSAVFNRARALMLEAYRDYHTTATGHDRADELDMTAMDYFRASSEAIQRLTDRPRSTVELI